MAVVDDAVVVVVAEFVHYSYAVAAEEVAASAGQEEVGEGEACEVADSKHSSDKDTHAMDERKVDTVKMVVASGVDPKDGADFVEPAGVELA